MRQNTLATKNVKTVMFIILICISCLTLVSRVYAYKSTSIQTGTLYDPDGHWPIAKFGTVFRYDADYGGNDPCFFPAVEVHTAGETHYTLYYVTQLKTTVSGTKPNGEQISGLEFTDLGYLDSPHDTGSEWYNALTDIYDAIVDLIPAGGSTLLKLGQAAESGTGCDSTSAWAVWNWPSLTFHEYFDKGLQFRFRLHCDPDLPGTYTLNIKYHVQLYAYDIFSWVAFDGDVASDTIHYTFNSGSSDGGGGGCPYVYAWDGQQYVMDNNLLPASEMSNGDDVEDYYRLEQPFVPTYQGRTYSQYSMQIREFEYEHDYLDQVKLFAVDHSSNVNAAVSPYGEILTYSNPAPATSAVDNNGVDVLSLLSSVDENHYQGYNGSYITLTFTPTDVSNGVKLVIREDTYLLKCPVYVQVLNATENWNTVAIFYTRTYWATDILNMTGYLPDPEGNLKVRLCFVSNDKIDYVGLDTTPQASIEIHQAFLLSAFHSTQGNVKPLLMENDQTYAELIPGEQIQLMFLLKNNQNQERTFILYAEGHYSTIAP